MCSEGGVGMEDSEGGEDVEVCGEGAEDGGFTVDEEGI